MNARYSYSLFLHYMNACSHSTGIIRDWEIVTVSFLSSIIHLHHFTFTYTYQCTNYATYTHSKEQETPVTYDIIDGYEIQIKN